MIYSAINSTERRYKKSRDDKKNVVLALRTTEDGRPKESHFLNLTGIQAKTSKRRNRYFVKQLAKTGQLDEILSPDDLVRASSEGLLPEHYVVDYKVPLDLGGAGKLNNMYVVDTNVAALMDILYWHQIRLEINAWRDRYKGQKPSDRIMVSFAQIPNLFTQKDFLGYVLAHERKGLQKYLIKKTQQDTEKSEKVTVQNFADGNVLWTLTAPEELPKGTKMAILKVSPRLWIERNRLRTEYMALRPKMVLASLRRGDFSDLSIAMQRQIRKTSRVPFYTNKTCHHILPLALGGANTMQNICWLDDNIHKLLHQKFISPFEAYMYGRASLPENLFFEIPIPLHAQIPHYRLTQTGLKLVESDNLPHLKKTLKTAFIPSKPDKKHNKKYKRAKLLPPDPENEA